MSQQERILDAVGELSRLGGRPPSILDVARHVGLTKQGVLHYFPTRADLDHAVLVRAVDRIDTAMQEAAKPGSDSSPTATYLRLSTPGDSDVAAAAVMLAAVPTQARGLPPEVTDAFARWEALIAADVGDPVRAEVIRLTSDGLFAESLASGTPPDPDRVERLIAHLTQSRAAQP